MRFYVVLRYTSFTLLLSALFLFISGAIAQSAGSSDALPLLYSAGFATLLAVFPLIFIPAFPKISNKEGTLIVVLSWVLACIMGAIPYILYGTPFTVTNAFFESVSGFTTTGSTILQDIEALPAGLLFWRASTHWIGGIGIVIFVLSLLPFLGFSEVVLFRSEVSSLARQNLRIRARYAMRVLVGIYVGLTILEFLSLILAGMSGYDAICHAFATIATGGFSTHNASIAYFDSIWIECIIMFFMILSGMPFILLFALVAKGDFKSLRKASVVRFYLITMALGIFITLFDLMREGGTSLGSALRFASFNVLSVGTSTGFANADTAIWPHAARMLLLLFTLQCACAGSTSGGIKVDRVLLSIKSVIRRTKQIMRPRAVVPLRFNGEVVKDRFGDHAVIYILLYIGIVTAGALSLSLLGTDLTEAFSGAAAAMGNVGPGLGGVGSLGNYAHIPGAGKWILSGLMLLGRLEVFALIIVFTPVQWTSLKSY